MLAIWVPVIVALIAPIGAYLLAARKMSGKIGTSDADRLWKEAQAIRSDLRDQIEECRTLIQNLTIQFEDCKRELARVTALTNRLQQENP